MRWYYAQIDENNICVGISDLSGEVNAPDMIKIDNYNEALLGKKYNNSVGRKCQSLNRNQYR